jgi:hypothetical protein
MGVGEWKSVGRIVLRSGFVRDLRQVIAPGTVAKRDDGVGEQRMNGGECRRGALRNAGVPKNWRGCSVVVVGMGEMVVREKERIGGGKRRNGTIKDGKGRKRSSEHLPKIVNNGDPLGFKELIIQRIKIK